jgi:DNA modification methylase
MFMMTHEWIFVFGNNPKNLNRTIPNQLDKYEARYGKDWDKGLKDKSIRGTDDKMKTTTSKTYSHHQLHTVIQQTPELGHIRKDHPATFPIGLPTEYIKAMTNENHVVAESFTGSGTTMVASHQLKRKCYGMELDPKYCQVIVDRMLKLDPTLEVKRNGIPYIKTVAEQ